MQTVLVFSFIGCTLKSKGARTRRRSCQIPKPTLTAVNCQGPTTDVQVIPSWSMMVPNNHFKIQQPFNSRVLYILTSKWAHCTLFADQNVVLCIFCKFFICFPHFEIEKEKSLKKGKNRLLPNAS